MMEQFEEMSQQDKAFEKLLDFLHLNRGIDFSSYKRAGLLRRLRKRMSVVGIEELDQYQDYLEVHPDEFNHLFDAVLINMTEFFRDEAVWDYLRNHILPKLLGAGPHKHLRVWAAGCASGEEAYSILLLFAEAIGIEQTCQRIKIYATDLDEDALAQGRVGSYNERSMHSIPPALRDRYFDTSANGRSIVKKSLRRCVVFGRHDLLQDAPISHIDLLLCRNVLMYFHSEAQIKILSRFNFALENDGILVLGRAETLLSRGAVFSPVDLRMRVFSKVVRRPIHDALALPVSGRRDGPLPGKRVKETIREMALDHNPMAQIVIDLHGNLVMANEWARSLFGLSAKHVGRALKDLDIASEPVDLPMLLKKVQVDKAPVLREEVQWTDGDRRQLVLDISVVPLKDSAGKIIGVAASYADVSRHVLLQNELEQSKQELQGAYEELQSTSEELQTTNEELQSAVEELETTNEELQSTNEELETMNEEFQSTNEELRTLNDEARQRTEDLNQANAFLESILGGLEAAVVVLDDNLRVLAWNPQAEELWGLRSTEVVGRQFVSLDTGLPVDRLIVPIRQCLANGAHERGSIEAMNRRGKPIRCEVTCTPLKGANEQIRGVITLMQQLPAP